jgi:hypothetical protein
MLVVDGTRAFEETSWMSCSESEYKILPHTHAHTCTLTCLL